MKKLIFLMIASMSLMFTSCSENYSNGERIGVITQFSETGLFFKSWEGHLNTTQTGMNSSVPFDFSIDNDAPDQQVINTLDSAALNGWKIKLVYHQVKGWNWFQNRGNTDHFVTEVEVLDRNFGNPFMQMANPKTIIDTVNKPVIHDTLYLPSNKNVN